MIGISIVIPTLNRSSYLLNTVSDLLKQKVDFPFEIIVVDQSEMLDSAVMRIAKESNGVVHYHHIDSFTGLPEARNYGARESVYDFILFLDDDVECSDNLLAEHFKSLSKEDIAVVAGGITERYRPNKDVKKVGHFDYFTATPFRGFHKKESGFVDHGGGGNYSVKANVFYKVGGVDEYLNYGAALYEESELCLRIKEHGYKVYFNSRAHVFHLAAETGGCRVPLVDRYVKSLVHNRSLVINRHLKWFHKPIANLYLLRLVLAYIVSARKLSLLSVIWEAYQEGRSEAALPPKNSFR